MSDLPREFATTAAATRESWRRDVDRSLKGRSFDEALIKPTIEGVPLQPLYTREDWSADRETGAPGAGAFARGLPAADGVGHARQGWTRCVEVEHPDARQANRLILADLEGGAQRVCVRTASARHLLAAGADATGRRVASRRGGIWIDSIDTVEELRVLLADVMWGLAPVTVVAPTDAACARRLFEACDTLRGSGGEGLGAQIDLVALARHARDDASWLREYHEPIEAEVRRAVAGVSSPWDARPLWIATSELRQAGADMVQEAAAALGVFVAAVRALDARGLSASAVLRATEFRLSAGSDFFGEIARLRAFRRGLALVLETLGITADAKDALITVSTAEETLTRRDIHVNLLRTTAEATAAVLGGADGLIIHPFDTRLAGGSALGRRLARNLHSLIAEESDAGAVIDPGGGSFYIERRTEQLAEAAWHQFVEWERAGGFVRARASGLVSTAIDQRWQTRAARLRTRRESLLGVNVFPHLDEKQPEITPFDGEAFLREWQTRVGARHAAGDTTGDAASDVDSTKAEADERNVHYLDEAFEGLRETADRLAARNGASPVVFGALLGEPAAYGARLDWTRDLLASAGLRLDARQVGEPTGDASPAIDVHGAASAIVIAPDPLHGSSAPPVISALRRAGLAEVAVAGRPGEHEAALRQAGATSFIFAGADLIPFLARLLAIAEAAHARS